MTAVVQISDVFEDAIKVDTSEIRPGDYVFTTSGERIRVKRVRKLKQLFKITREDGWIDYFLKDDRITIVKA
jgi:hypothetical protein